MLVGTAVVGLTRLNRFAILICPTPPKPGAIPARAHGVWSAEWQALSRVVAESRGLLNVHGPETGEVAIQVAAANRFVLITESRSYPTISLVLSWPPPVPSAVPSEANQNRDRFAGTPGLGSQPRLPFPRVSLHVLEI